MNAIDTDTTTTLAAVVAASGAHVAPTKTTSPRTANKKTGAPKAATATAKAPKVAAAPRKPAKKPAATTTKAPKTATRARKAADVSSTPPKPGEGTTGAKKAATAPPSKKAIVLNMLRARTGATMAEIMKATGWQTHTVRGFVAGTLTKKMGLTVESTKNAAGERTYRIAAK